MSSSAGAWCRTAAAAIARRRAGVLATAGPGYLGSLGHGDWRDAETLTAVRDDAGAAVRASGGNRRSWALPCLCHVLQEDATSTPTAARIIEKNVPRRGGVSASSPRHSRTLWNILVVAAASPRRR